MSQHEKFIKTHIIRLVEDAVLASHNCGMDMERFSLSEYIMQALFLKMTGFNEQKLKCIIWELATDDYDFRYELLSNKFKCGECSSYADKNNTLGKLMHAIKRVDERGALDKMRADVISDSINECESAFVESALREWYAREYSYYKALNLQAYTRQFFIKNGEGFNLFDKGNNSTFSLYKAFDHMYKHRNRCAHNLLSYQENLPEFISLEKNEYEKYENWFLRIFLLVLIDNCFVNLYDIYMEKKAK